jgi:NTP pyrophosphatase (non-canonical NTP hydrolase)
MLTWKERYKVWHDRVFGDCASEHGRKVYAMRLLEEALELAQAEGVTPIVCAAIQYQVYSKPAGNPEKELGGVLVTMTGYALYADLDIEATFETELERIQDEKIIDRVRYRNFHGDKIGMRHEA